LFIIEIELKTRMGDKLIIELQNRLKDIKISKKNGRGQEETCQFVINREMLENFKKSKFKITQI
jgi:hypothetical protein